MDHERDKSVHEKLDNCSLNQFNNDNLSSKGCSNNQIMKGDNENESIPSFGFTQEQVACVCEVLKLVRLKFQKKF